MKENNNGNDANVGSIENSIEEAIERLEYIDRTYSCNNYYSIWDLKCIEILLSDYKRVLKENEELKSNNEKYIIHLTDGQYKTVIEIAQNDINQKWIQKVKDKISERQFELQQEYKDFENDSILIVLQELLEGRE